MPKKSTFNYLNSAYARWTLTVIAAIVLMITGMYFMLSDSVPLHWTGYVMVGGVMYYLASQIAGEIGSHIRTGGFRTSGGVEIASLVIPLSVVITAMTWLICWGGIQWNESEPGSAGLLHTFCVLTGVMMLAPLLHAAFTFHWSRSNVQHTLSLYGVALTLAGLSTMGLAYAGIDYAPPYEWVTFSSLGFQVGIGGFIVAISYFIGESRAQATNGASATS